MTKPFEYISDFYYSNCMIEALKAKIRNPSKVRVYFCKPDFRKGHFQFIHFMWDDEDASYDFSDCEEDRLPLYKLFFFKGKIRRFKHGFAEKYSKQRNRKGNR